MTHDTVLRLTAELLRTGLLVAAPLLGTALVVGLLVGVLQVLTQLQEMTLSFVPKLLAIGAALMLAGPWMLQQVCGFAVRLWARIPQLSA